LSNVKLEIGGRGFTVACGAGEEDHIAELGRMIDARLATMGNTAGQSETRMLLFAALLLADELHDRGDDARGSLASAPDDDLSDRLGALAEKLENLAVRLETSPGSA